MNAKSGRENQTMVITPNSGYVNTKGGLVTLPRIGLKNKMRKNSGRYPNTGIGNIFQNVPGIGFGPNSLGRKGIDRTPAHGFGQSVGINNYLMSSSRPVGLPKGLVGRQVSP